MSTSLAQTSAGTTISISATLPAQNDQAGFEALTFTEIGEVTSIGGFGITYNEVTHNPLGDRKTFKFKGSYDNGTLTVDYALVDDDAGQLILDAAVNSDNNYAFEISRQDGAKRYFIARVMSKTETIGGVDDISSASTDLSINGNIVKVAAP